MNKKSNLQLFSVIKGGGEAVSLSSSMPSWGNYLQDQDIWNVVAWIRAMADANPTTLEEPPDYTVFILATTDPYKMPATILSRTQRYDFQIGRAHV